MALTARSTGRGAVSDTTKPYRGRRISWEQFYTFTGRKPPVADNDNAQAEEQCDAA